MAKNVIKEIIIVLLLLLAIILVLGVILYDYVPTNKRVPDKVSYTTPQNVKEELQNSQEVDKDKVILTYTLDQNDLYNYQITNDYRPGKTNPFSSYKTQKGDGSGTDEGNSQSGGSSSGNTSGGSSSVTPIKPGEVNPGNYTPDKGLK